MVMGLVKMAPDAWAYYAVEIADGREDYFAREEPGRWVGAGAERLALLGSVTPESLARLFSEACHPETGEAIGRPFGVGRGAVAGYALSFSPPKSVSVLWALGGEETSAAVRAGHDAAVAAALSYLERHAAFTRRGKAGVLQVDTDGFVGAAFVHRTSRTLDPQLHTHVLLSNKVRAADGTWLALDGRELYGHQKAAGVLYKAALRAELAARLGVSWSRVDGNGIAEIEGVPTALVEHWSTRRHEVKVEAARLVAQREAALGRALSGDERAEAHQLAAYRTRGAKGDETRADSELRRAWHEEAEELGFGPDGWMGEVLAGAERRGPSPAEALERVLAVLEESSSTWSRADATEVLACLLDHRRYADAASLHDAVEEGVATLLALPDVLQLTAPVLAEMPAGQVCRDGFAAHIHHGAVRYSTLATLARESSVLEAAAEGTAAGLAVLAARLGLGSDQRDALERICGSGEAICCVVGPAGAGKSRMLEAARIGFEEDGRKVIGLAPSAMAAEVLHQEAGISSETLARFLLRANAGTEKLHAGDVVVLDEATMVRSTDLAALVRHTTAAGAKLVAVGDPAQLGAVGAGGLFRTLAHDTGAAELGTLRRFRAPWEASALLRLRARDATILATYVAHGRIVGADRDRANELAFRSWVERRAQGRAVLVMASDHETVDALALRARAALVAAGEVEPDGLRAGRQLVGVGDEIVSLKNERRLVASGGAWVRNGDRWRVAQRSADGSLEVVHAGGHGTVRLPSAYVAEHVALAYVLTVHKAQGTTVDEAVVVVDKTMTAEQLYVAMSRGRDRNQAVVVCEAPDTGHGRFATPTPAQVLARVLQRQGTEMSATETLRRELERAEHPTLGDPRLIDGRSPAGIGDRRRSDQACREHRRRSTSRDRGQGRTR